MDKHSNFKFYALLKLEHTICKVSLLKAECFPNAWLIDSSRDRI